MSDPPLRSGCAFIRESELNHQRVVGYRDALESWGSCDIVCVCVCVRERERERGGGGGGGEGEEREEQGEKNGYHAIKCMHSV